jgi:hypothetical protein
MFPNLQGSTAAYTGRPSKYGGALSGASRQVPNPADWVAAGHKVAPPSSGEPLAVVLCRHLRQAAVADAMLPVVSVIAPTASGMIPV